MPASGEVHEITDLDEVEQLLSSVHTRMRIEAKGPPGPVRVRLARSPLGPAARLDRVSFSVSIAVHGAPLGRVHVNHLRSGRAGYGGDGSSRRYGAGDVFLAVQPEHSYTAASESADVELAVLDPALLTQIADVPAGRDRQPIRLAGYQPISAQAAERWKTTFAYVNGIALADPDGAAAPLVAANAARLLAATALSVFPSNAVTDPAAADRNDAHPGTVRRAIAYIEEHATDPDIAVADIAAASWVTIRAVQLAFRRHLDTTPTEYLRRVRLERAHHELERADPARETVTAVGYRWGFPSPSAFAWRYRQAYGVTPGHTLRQR